MILGLTFGLNKSCEESKTCLKIKNLLWRPSDLSKVTELIIVLEQRSLDPNIEPAHSISTEKLDEEVCKSQRGGKIDLDFPNQKQSPLENDGTLAFI